MEGFFIILCVIISLTRAADWTYCGEHGPYHWEEEHSICGHNKQSPINIEPQNAVYNEDLGFIIFHNYGTDSSGKTWSFKNSGHGVTMYPPEETASISGGGLPGTYKLAQFHFHWGSNQGQGSEHTLDGTKFPMEMHLVHYLDQYSSFGEAADKENGLAVIGFFFEVSQTDNHNYDEIVDALSDIEDKSSSTQVTLTTALDNLIADTSRYWRYSGSITAPPCYETITWTVMKNTIPISQAQLEKFRSLHYSDGYPLQDNYRPVQPLNGRIVYANYEQKQSSLLRKLLSLN